MHNLETRQIIFRIFGLIVLIGIIIFSYLKYKPIIEGPLITNISLEKWNTVKTHSITIEGTVQNTQAMYLNSKELILDEHSSFSEIIPLNPGVNKVFIDIEDIFGKKREYSYNIYADYPEFQFETNLDLAEKKILEEQQAQEDEALEQNTEIELNETA